MAGAAKWVKHKAAVGQVSASVSLLEKRHAVAAFDECQCECRQCAHVAVKGRSNDAEVGHARLLERIGEEGAVFPGLELTGASYRGTGIPDCLCDGERAAQALWKTLTE